MKVGDYVICKKTIYVDNSLFFKKIMFEKHKRYRIDSIMGTMGSVGTIYQMSTYFYTKKEERAIKLKRINEKVYMQS